MPAGTSPVGFEDGAGPLFVSISRSVFYDI
jgi:hypothetical protein